MLIKNIGFLKPFNNFLKYTDKIKQKTLYRQKSSKITNRVIGELVCN